MVKDCGHVAHVVEDFGYAAGNSQRIRTLYMLVVTTIKIVVKHGCLTGDPLAVVEL